MKQLPNRRWLAGVFSSLLAFPLAAAGLAGTWTGFVIPDEGNRDPLYVRLQSAGDQITGTVGPREGEQYPISEGRLEGSRVTFLLAVPQKGVYHFNLVLEGDDLRGEVRLPSPEGERQGKIELKRAP
jgi:hypothetical protein